MPSTQTMTLLAILVGAASACAFSIDPSLVRPADDAGSDSQEEDAGSQEDDAGSQEDDSGSQEEDALDASEPDAHGDEASAAGSSDGGGIVATPGEGAPAGATSADAAANSGCSSDANCAADRMCVAAACVPRCSDSAGCAVATIPVIEDAEWNAINDGKNTVYYVYENSRDTRHDNVLWKYRRGMPPVALGHDYSPRAKPLFVANDYLYYLSNAQLFSLPHLYRVSLNGSAPEMVALEIIGAWRTAENVWWSKQVADDAVGGPLDPGPPESVCRLWKSPAEGPLTPTRLTAKSREIGCSWSTGSEEWVVRDLWPTVREAVILDFLPDLTRSLTVTPLNAAARLSGADDAAIYARMDGQFMRYWADPSTQSALTAPPARVAPRTADALEVSSWGWVYWRARDADGPSLGRAHRAIADYQRDGELLRLPSSATIDGFSALPTALVYLSAGRLYEKETPLTCGTGMPCPAWLSCQGTCR